MKPSSQLVCKYYRNGTCWRKDCPFAHVGNIPQKPYPGTDEYDYDSNDDDEQDEQDSSYFTNIFITNIPLDTTEKEFKNMFTRFGTIHDCKLLIHPREGLFKGNGMVRFNDPQSARDAIEAFKNQDIRVRFAERQPNYNSQPPTLNYKNRSRKKLPGMRMRNPDDVVDVLVTLVNDQPKRFLYLNKMASYFSKETGYQFHDYTNMTIQVFVEKHCQNVFEFYDFDKQSPWVKLKQEEIESPFDEVDEVDYVEVDNVYSTSLWNEPISQQTTFSPDPFGMPAPFDPPLMSMGSSFSFMQPFMSPVMLPPVEQPVTTVLDEMENMDIAEFMIALDDARDRSIIDDSDYDKLITLSDEELSDVNKRVFKRVKQVLQISMTLDSNKWNSIGKKLLDSAWRNYSL